MKHKLRDALVPAAVAASFIALYSLKSHGLSTILAFGTSMAVAYVFYMLTNYRSMPAPERILPIYLVAIGVQLLHFMEEFLGGFYIRHPVEFFHANPYSANEFVMSQSILFALMIVGALGIYFRWKIPMVFVWFMVIMLLFVNAVQHPIYAIMVKGYFPGLFTSFACLALAPIMFKRLWETRKALGA